jgi:hypothetical protein
LQVPFWLLLKLTATGQNVPAASLIEKSSSVLFNAENRRRDEIRGLSPDNEFREAA